MFLFSIRKYPHSTVRVVQVTPRPVSQSSFVGYCLHIVIRVFQLLQQNDNKAAQMTRVRVHVCKTGKAP